MRAGQLRARVGAAPVRVRLMIKADVAVASLDLARDERPMGTSPVPRANECDILAADRGDHVRVEACRPLDLATAPEVDAALRGALNGGRAVELDLRRISALGSSGINLLLRVSRRSRDRGATAQRHEGLNLPAVARYLPVVLGRRTTRSSIRAARARQAWPLGRGPTSHRDWRAGAVLGPDERHRRFGRLCSGTATRGPRRG